MNEKSDQEEDDDQKWAAGAFCWGFPPPVKCVGLN